MRAGGEAPRGPIDALTEVRIRKLRGIGDLRLPLEYPVSVLAGPNGCGRFRSGQRFRRRHAV